MMDIVYTLGEKIVLFLGTTFIEVVLWRRIIHMMRFMRQMRRRQSISACELSRYCTFQA
jgi:hypothetical protein